MPKGCAPYGLVSYARKWLARNPDTCDEVWCVFDVDEFPHVAEAVRSAADEQFFVAVSNPCFELWLLLHFVKHTAHLSDYASLRPKLARHLGNYDKNRLNTALFRDGVSDAVERARELDPTGAAFQLNPSTGVWRLVERIMG